MLHSYLIWLALFVLAPTGLLWAFYSKVLKRHWRVIFLAPVYALIFSIPWDYISIQERIWYYQTPYIAGLWIFGLPLEEYLFIIFVTLLFANISAVVWNYIGVPE